MDELPFYVGFSYLLGVGPVTFKLLKSKYSSIKKAYFADKKELAELLSPKLAEKIVTHRNTFDVEKELKMMKETNVIVITQEDSRYPNQLLELSDPPICLYVKGPLDKFSFENDIFFAVVGTRKPTYYGEHVTTKLAYELAKAGFVIVSGLALGVDALAHTAALEAGGRTIAFLGCGVNIMYPPSNRLLYKRIIEQSGLIISEVPPNMQVLPGLFVQRNRLISGLSKGILVSEGLKDSGSLITARFAAQQGKDVFAPPAPITSEFSEAPNILLKEGAKLVTNIDDILEEYSLTSKTNNTDRFNLLSSEEQAIYKLLQQQPYDSDELSRILQIPIYKMLSLLSSLEMQDIVTKNGSLYCLKIT